MNIKFALVAAATCAATILPAQTNIPVMGGTNITIGGLLAVGLKNAEVTNTTRPGITNETFLGDNTSRLVISATSKITDGWAVIMRMEARFQPTYGPGTALAPSIPSLGTNGQWYGSVAEGDTWGGISSPYGTITFGKSTLYYADTIDISYMGAPGAGEAYRIWDCNGLGTFNMLSQVPTFTKGAANIAAASYFTLGVTRSQDVVKYTSPKFGGGFDLALAWSKNPYGSTLNGLIAPPATPLSYENGGTVYGKLNYVNGGFVASLSVLDVRTQGGGNGSGSGYNDGQLLTYNPSLEAYRIGAAYKFGNGFRVGVVLDHTAVKGAADGVNTVSRDDFEVPVSYAWGDHAVYATYNKASNCNNYANSGATQINLGYDYAMTKRAFIGIFYTNINNQSNASYGPFLGGTNLGPTLNDVPGEGIHQIGLNLNYWF